MAKRRKKAKKPEPKWRMVERVVGLIEAALDPQAEIDHDVCLPDLATPGHTRQCDVVVTSGPQHRRTRTIFEVQRRGRKVEVGHFDGWVAKLRAVGAQHLVCVSSVGFPQSIKDKAAQLGPTVRLATLKELEKSSPLLQGALGRIQIHHCGTTTFPSIEVLVKDLTSVRPDVETLRHEEPVFRTAAGELLSLNQIAQRLLNKQSTPLSCGNHQMTFETADYFAFTLNDAVGPVRLRFVANVEVHETTLSCEVLEYKQLDDDGALAWALVGKTPRPDINAEYEFRVTFRPGKDGRLVPQSINISGLVPGDMFSARVASHSVGPVIIRSAPTTI